MDSHRYQYNEGSEGIYQVVSNFLIYQGIALSRQIVRELFFQFMKEYRQMSSEPYPEFDAVVFSGRS